MGNELKIFTNEEFGQIRTVLIENEPWFIGKDVATALGYADTKQAIRINVQEDDKKHLSKSDFKGCTSTTLEISNFGATVVNESGIYALIFGSKLESAKRFKHWVTSEVLPSIRRTGGYIQGQETLSEEELMARALEVARKTLERREQRLKDLEQTVSVQNQRIAELQPKADYTDKILQSKSLMTITQIAKDYGMSGKRMNEILNHLRVQYKQNGQWLLYSKYQSKGYTSSETMSFRKDDGRIITKLDTKWTQKGRLFLYELLKENDIIPIIEQDNAF